MPVPVPVPVPVFAYATKGSACTLGVLTVCTASYLLQGVLTDQHVSIQCVLRRLLRRPEYSWTSLLEFYKELDNGEAERAISSGTASARVGLGLYSMSLDTNGGAVPPTFRSATAANAAIVTRNTQRAHQQQQQQKRKVFGGKASATTRTTATKLSGNNRDGKDEGAHGFLGSWAKLQGDEYSDTPSGKVRNAMQCNALLLRALLCKSSLLKLRRTFYFLPFFWKAP